MLSEVAELEQTIDAVPVPHDWSEVSVAHAVTMLPGFAFKSENFVTEPDQGLPLIRIRDLGQTATATRYLGDYDGAFAVRDGDILIGMDGEFAAVRWQGGKALLNQRVLKLSTARPGELDEGYLFYRVQPALSELEQTISGTTVKHLSTKDLKRLAWQLPPIDEQRRIAEVLRSVDEALHTARDVADQCEQVLRIELNGIAARLFAEDAPQVKLGAVARVKGGKRLPKGSDYSDVPTGNPYIRVSDWHDYEIRTDNLRYISDEIARAIWRYTISASDIFISIAGSVGLVATVPQSLEGAYLTENAAKICINDPSTLDTMYLLALLRSGSLAEQIAKHKGVGGGVPKLALFRIEDLDIPVPDVPVQIEIGETYQSLRAGVEAARAAVRQLEATRMIVMADLLSGRVRMPA